MAVMPTTEDNGRGYTAGKWSAEEAATNCIDITAGGRVIASVMSDESEDHLTPEDEANARLMVNSPALLKALLAFPEDPNPYTYRKAYAKARAAIAKATVTP